MQQNIRSLGFINSLLIFAVFAVLLYVETHFLIPFLSTRTGIEPVLFWFIVAGLGLFLPMLLLAAFMIKQEGLKFDRHTWSGRLRFKKMDAGDWLWSLGGVVIIAVLSMAVMHILELLTGRMEAQPPFMHVEPLTAGRYWILLVWFPFWVLNIMGEEILWRGVLLPRQEIVFGKFAWILQGFLWTVFHLAFGWKLLLTMLPILFVLPYVVQRRRNSWTGVVIHAVSNGPTFVAIALGWL